MLFIKKFDPVQINILFASILGDGEITKAYPNSRRKNVSYREHFSLNQYEYRKWKSDFFPEFLYFRKQKDTLVSKSSPIMTELYAYFYNSSGNKRIPPELLLYCLSPYFVATLYMDDGSLLVSKRINHKSQKIYLSPVIALYLQNYPYDDLVILSSHFDKHFKIKLRLQKRKDGHGFILRTSKMNDTLHFLKIIMEACRNCMSMYYKTNWEYRFQLEAKILNQQHPDYSVIASSSERNKNYTPVEIKKLAELKINGYTDQKIADELNRSYWSVVYKIAELKKKGHLESR
ncbi:DNA endonuclease [Aquibacillus halophilus]|uniref:DNA endonuclease n=1 Tax=Aquibacillus halophilus TaxID=930132 RepID=A0A6A8DBR7_9BACI|nr:DNA endonuclease [Aquibacillus halophilus]MRH41976.1 DNA endonuclease [Aquibacillus halophilus]